jgi:hypothetical protein
MLLVVASLYPRVIQNCAWCAALDKMESGAGNIGMQLYRRVRRAAYPQAAAASQLVTGRHKRACSAPVRVTM